MGYACPVCGDPQADSVHLANHLAITALARGGDHETWLDDHVSDWSDCDESTLADQVAPHAEEREFPHVFEDSTGEFSPDHAHERGPDRHETRGHETDAGDEMSDILEDARELTERRRDDSETE